MRKESPLRVPRFFFPGILFLAGALTVLWQNSRLAILWDLSYVMEISWRISQGDVPYRDFVLPQSPGTFLLQALIVKAFPPYVFHIIYAALLCGLGNVLTYFISLRLLEGRISRANIAAFFLTLPAAFLGIYCVYPHPFYDPDTAFFILFAIWLYLRWDRQSFRGWRGYFTGCFFSIPFFFKQNIGLFFMAGSGVVFLYLFSREKESFFSRRHLKIVAGSVAFLLLCLIAIGIWAGIDRYFYWIFQYASQKRLPGLSRILEIYTRGPYLSWIFAGVIAFVWKLIKPDSGPIAFFIFLYPFFFCFYTLVADPTNLEDVLISTWPYVCVFSTLFAFLRFRQEKSFPALLPLILVFTAQGAFLAQQISGSTYAIWPLLLVLMSSCYLFFLETSRPSLLPVFFFSCLLTLCGFVYVYSESRLSYARWNAGKIHRSDLPALSGLSVQGNYLPDFEELLAFAEKSIPPDSSIASLPGEDPFFYASRRKPAFPVIVLDKTANPYEWDEFLLQLKMRRIEWIVVKRRLQLEGDEEQDFAVLTGMIAKNFPRRAALRNYYIYYNTVK